MTFVCAHCGAKIPERGYTCQMCGKVCREKVAGSSAAPKKMLIADGKETGVAKKPAPPVKPAPPPPPAPARKASPAKKASAAKKAPSGHAMVAATLDPARAASELSAPPPARDENSELWKEFMRRAAEPEAPSVSTASGVGKEMPSILDAGKTFDVKPLDLFPEGRTTIGSGGGTDILEPRRGVTVTAAPLFSPPQVVSGGAGEGAQRYRLDFTSLGTAPTGAAGATGAPVPAGRQLCDGAFLQAFRARASGVRAPVARPAAPGSRAALVACICPSMNRFLADLAADSPEHLLVIRVPGGVATERNGALPALLSSLLAYGAVEVAFLAHDGCMLEGLMGSDLAGLLRATGHPRAGFPGDLRDAACVTPPPAQSLPASCALLERHPAFASVAAHGLHLSADGKVRVVVDGYARFAAG